MTGISSAISAEHIGIPILSYHTANQYQSCAAAGSHPKHNTVYVFIKPILRSNISLATYIHVGVWIVCKRYHPCGVDKISCKSKYSSVRSYDEQTLLLHIKFRLSGEFAIIDNGDVVCQHRLPVICAPHDVILTKNINVVSSSFSRPRPMG